ncbi:adenylate/guanylate cyclase domain-containing protein [Clostridium sp. Mt-5]|uniref:Adenylate/guanylate cyclase domain-containing protein n=1 Tax=Clostridium moutaii TaxID=3240932 RepID=A0ABV4BNR6_9CLOT
MELLDIDINELKREVTEKFELAKKNVLNELTIDKKFAKDISNNIPNYDINKMKFGAYEKDKFVSFFADMRDSTNRAMDIGAKDTFLTIHAIMPAMIYIIEAYGGSIVDLPGDGVMALFKGNPKNIRWVVGGKYLNEESLAVGCGKDLLTTFEEIVNPILVDNNIKSVTFGVGIDTGEVIVTKVGTDKIRDIKAIGNCINNSSKNSDGSNEIWISVDTYNSMDERLKKNFYLSYRVDKKTGENIKIYRQKID